MNLSTLLQTITKEYHFHVYHTTPLEHGFRLETNVGSKYAFIWNQKEQLQRSFYWKEEVAKKGFRQIDRFIRTRDGAPFVQINKEYLVIQDAFDGEEMAYGSAEVWERVGQICGMIYIACVESSSSFQNEQQNLPTDRDQPLPLSLVNLEDLTLMKRKLLAQDNMFTHLVHLHWKELEKRWKHAQAIERASHAKNSFLLFYPTLHLEQWVMLERGLALQSKNCPLLQGLQGISEFMQEAFLQPEVGLEQVEAFLTGFESTSQASLEEHYLIMAHMIYPRTFMRILGAYLAGMGTIEESVEKWMDECEKQEKLDQLYVWFAERIDRLREETVSL